MAASSWHTSSLDTSFSAGHALSQEQGFAACSPHLPAPLRKSPTDSLLPALSSAQSQTSGHKVPNQSIFWENAAEALSAELWPVTLPHSVCLSIWQPEHPQEPLGVGTFGFLGEDCYGPEKKFVAHNTS